MSLEMSQPHQNSPLQSLSSTTDLCEYLEQETESTTTQDFLQQLLQKEVVDSGILESLRSDRNSKSKKQRDPRLNMELRHQQVKENRARRQQEQEKRRQELALKKSALSQAQALVQEESKKKALKAKKEEEEIQREMVKLRKEMNERRRVMEEARQLEWKRQEMGKSVKLQERISTQGDLQREDEKRKVEKQDRIKELLSQIYAENHKCLQTYFSTWYKLVLERRVKMGKARALADWKHQLRAFRAWRDYAWSRKLERETQRMETELRDQNRKQQLAQESYRKRLLRHYLVEWQLWTRAEKEKRELEARKEATKRKMAALLEAASSLGVPREVNEGQRDSNMGSPASHGLGVEGSRAEDVEPRTPVALSKNPPMVPKHAWQVTREHAALTQEELDQHRMQSSNSARKLQKRAPSYGENFENRHLFQQQLIEEQRRQLQEQKEMILGLMENQRLIISNQEARKATAFTAELNSQVLHPKEMCRKKTDTGTAASPVSKNGGAPSLNIPSVRSERSNSSPPQSTASSARRTAAHPVVKAMEERAAQRAERRKELEETRRRREEEKLAQLKAEEDERLRQEASEKEAQLERKREEKRLQRQKEQEKLMRLQRDQELQEKARAHHEKALVRCWGLVPWKKMMTQSRQDMERAERHHCSVIQRRCLLAWLQAKRDIMAEKVSRAEELWSNILLRRYFCRWVKYKDHLSILEEKAERRFKSCLRRKTFLAWLDVAQEEKAVMWEKQRIAAEHNQKRILLTAFRVWRNFPKFIRDLKLKEERRELLRKMVADILPDFRM
ncbi:coiled-coil domain-containing protein 191 isoform 2-T2 [Rhinophrynus dorsalis]